jgi:hypothetical protein
LSEGEPVGTGQIEFKMLPKTEAGKSIRLHHPMGQRDRQFCVDILPMERSLTKLLSDLAQLPISLTSVIVASSDDAMRAGGEWFR